jgi:YgiT-type zinc finger domain-containing protein
MVCGPNSQDGQLVAHADPLYNEDMANGREDRGETTKCLHCQAAMKPGRAPIHIDRDGCHVTIDNVPAWICEQCGEPLFDEQVVEAVQGVAKVVDEKWRFLQRSA